MGGVLVRKNISYQQPIGDSGFYLDPMASKGKNKSLPNMSGTDRSPAEVASAQVEAGKVQGELEKLPSQGAIEDPDERYAVGVQRAKLKDIEAGAAPRSHNERYGVSAYNKLRTPSRKLFGSQTRQYSDEVANRAGEAAGRVGVRGRKVGGVLGGALAGGLGVLSAATALDEAGASGQSFDRALTGAGLAGYSTGSTMQQTLTPHLRTAGGAIGSKFASPKYVRPPVAVNPPTTAPPVAVTPSVIPGTGTDSEGRSFSPRRSTVRGQGETFSQAYDAPLSTAQNKERLTAINAQAQNSNMGMTDQMAAEKVGITRRLNPTNVAQPFNPQVQEGAMDMFNAPQQVGVVPGSSRVEPSGSTTVQQGLPGMATPKAEPTNPVAVEPTQTKLDVDAAAAEFPKAPVGSVEDGENKGAIGQQAGAEGVKAGQQFLPVEEKENQTAEPGTTGKAGA